MAACRTLRARSLSVGIRWAYAFKKTAYQPPPPTADATASPAPCGRRWPRRPHALDVFVPSAAVASGPEPTGM